MVRRGGLELACRREAAEAPLIEPLAAQPDTPRKLTGPGTHRIQQTGDVADARPRAVEVRRARGEGMEVEMRVDEPREDGRPPAVEALGPTAGEPRDLGLRADRQDAPAGDGERGGGGSVRVERHDPRVLEQPVGGGQSEEGSGFASFSFIS